MALISAPDQERLRESFGELKRPVRLLFFTQTIGCETCPMTRQILDELPGLSDKITVEEVNVVLDAERAKRYGIERAPGVVILWTDEAGQDQDSRIRFLGAPSGYEFISLVQAVLLAGGRESILSSESRALLEALDQPITMKVFTTPT
jgi:alkyl hydroperoxide reductase subunit AhpF